MRRCVFALVLAAFLVAPAIAQKPFTALEGTWEMVSQRVVYPDSVVNRGLGLGPSFKILNSTHFAFGRQTVVQGEPEEDVYAGGGRYELIGDTLYVEHIEYHSSLGNVGTSISFQVRVDGDIWYQVGRIGETRLEEIWKRVR